MSRSSRCLALVWAVGLWALLGVVLAVVTTRMTDWFDMTDELRYERLAISIARTHSLVPRIHDINIRSYSQLYPLVLAPVFAHGYVPHDLRNAHLLNALVMSSAFIPAFLLTRQVTGRDRAAYLVAFLSICVPWILYATMLLTEVTAYPVFLWSALAMQRAVAAPSHRNDLIVLLTLAIDYFARTALIVLVVVLPIAIVAYEFGRCPRKARTALSNALAAHVVLSVAYILFATGALALKLSGHFSSIFGVYGYYSNNQNFFGNGSAGSLVEHIATFSLGIGVLPFVVGAAWLFANIVRPPSDRNAHAFACIGTVTIIAVVIQTTVFDVRYTHFVHDRFMIYLAPLLVLGVMCALADKRRPHWSLVAPTALVVLGFVFGAVPNFTWQRFSYLNPDTPASAFYRPLAGVTHGLLGARVLLVAATLSLVALFALGTTWHRRSRLTWGMVTLMLVLIPVETSYVFARLFGVAGISGRPVTANMSGSFDWVDRRVGTHADVTMIPYPVDTQYFNNERVWRDYEFWNKSVDRDVHYPYSAVFESTGFWFPKQYVHFDSSGVANITLSRYVLEADQESRFRISGTTQADESGVMLIDARKPWRLDWLTSGLYEDGWTKPGVTAIVRVFAAQGQHGARTRNLTLGLRAPEGVATRRVAVDSNLNHLSVEAAPSTHVQVRLCVPERGYTQLNVKTPDHSPIPPNMRNLDYWNAPGREGGVFVNEVALADEVGGRCRPGGPSD